MFPSSAPRPRGSQRQPWSSNNKGVIDIQHIIGGIRGGAEAPIVLEARAAFGTLWASERKRETYYLVYILSVGSSKTLGGIVYCGDFEDVCKCCRFLQPESRPGIKPSGARVA